MNVWMFAGVVVAFFGVYKMILNFEALSPIDWIVLVFLTGFYFVSPLILKRLDRSHKMSIWMFLIKSNVKIFLQLCFILISIWLYLLPGVIPFATILIWTQVYRLESVLSMDLWGQVSRNTNV
jgi:hypothetical protein